MEIFSKTLRYERKLQGYTQATIAAALGISRKTYGNYEAMGTKQGREPPLIIILKISEVLGVSIDYLFGKED